MAKPNPRVASVGDMRSRPNVKRATPSAKIARTVQRRGSARSDELAIDLAREGDDSALLPYQPTPSINPPRPRTLAAGYNRETETLRVRFRDGQVYEYFDVPERVWRNFKRVKSPGRAINRTLNQYEYAPMDL